LILIFPLIVSACGGGDVSAEDAEKALRAAFDGDVDEVNKYTCDSQKATAENLAVFDMVELKSISCEEDGDNITCSITMSTSLGEGVEHQEMTQEITIPVEDGKLCGSVGPATP
ncbi:MAG TPA: hypothetical protein VJZ27_05265, partial [Aggregatilineales bacterium]|nr:hypothetical protein [Aggregatilineales bacterium]